MGRNRSGRTVFVSITAAALAVTSGFGLERVLGGTAETRVVAEERPLADPAADPAPEPAAESPAPPVFGAEPAPPLKKLRVRPTKTAGPAAGGGTPGSNGGSNGGSSGGSSGGGATGTPGPEGDVVRLTNAERAKAGCPALRTDSRLTTAARRHSADMKAKNYFSHTSADGRSFSDRIKATGYPSPGAENIAMGYGTAAAVMKGWMNSSGHRANILNCGLKAIGVGVATGGRGPYWTQNFGWT